MSSQGSHEEAHGRYLAALSLTALGIVFGDIGTSPIYALSVVKVADDMYKVIASYGFAESPDVPSILKGCEKSGLAFDMMHTTFFLSRETLVAHRKGGMARWRKRLFSRMSRNSLQATAYFGIPPNRVVELGMQVQL